MHSKIVVGSDTVVGYLYYVTHLMLLKVWHKRRQEGVCICCNSLNAACLFVCLFVCLGFFFFFLKKFQFGILRCQTFAAVM